MARNTRAYNNARNARRQAENRIKVIKQQLTYVRNNERRDELAKQLKSYQNAVEATRTYSKETGKRIRTAQEVAANVQILAQMNRQNGQLVKSQARQNRLTTIEINRASVGASSEYTQSQVHIFYRATQKYWNREGVALEDRNKAILEGMGVRSLKEAFESITANPYYRTQQLAVETLQNPEATDEQKAMAMQILQDNEDEFVLSIPASEAAGSIPDIAPNA